MRHLKHKLRTLRSGIGNGNGAWAANLRHFGSDKHGGNCNARRVAMAVATTRTAAKLSSDNVTKFTNRMNVYQNVAKWTKRQVSKIWCIMRQCVRNYSSECLAELVPFFAHGDIRDDDVSYICHPQSHHQSSPWSSVTVWRQPPGEY